MINEQQLLEEMIEMIEQQTSLVLDPETLKGLLLEVQRDQLKGLVYRAFLAINQRNEAPAVEQTPQEEPNAIVLGAE